MNYEQLLKSVRTTKRYKHASKMRESALRTSAAWSKFMRDAVAVAIATNAASESWVDAQNEELK